MLKINDNIQLVWKISTLVECNINIIIQAEAKQTKTIN